MGLKYAIAMAHGVKEVNGKVSPSDNELAELDAMTPHQLMRLWTQWHMGSGEWADEFIDVWNRLNHAGQPPADTESEER